MNYLPFDLETALKHPERVVTRDGRKVEQLHKFYIDESYPLYGVIGKDLKTWGIKGNYTDNTDSNTDLFLLPEVKECWVNVYSNGWGQPYVKGGSYQTKENAKFIAGTEKIGYIKTVRITNETE